jgi:hypothetical protein
VQDILSDIDCLPTPVPDELPGGHWHPGSLAGLFFTFLFWLLWLFDLLQGGAPPVRNIQRGSVGDARDLGGVER